MTGQLRIGSCTASAVLALLLVSCTGQTLPDYQPGRTRSLPLDGAEEGLGRRRLAERDGADGGPRGIWGERLNPRGQLPVPRREPAEEIVRPDHVGEAAVRTALQRRVPDIIWPGIPWSDAVSFFQGDPDLGLNIVPVWPALKNEGIPPDRLVTLRASNLTVAEALDRLMELVGTGHTPDARPVWYIRGNVVVITTAARRAAETAAGSEP